MKYLTLLFALFSVSVWGQNELSLNSANPIDVQTNQIKDVNIQVINTDANPDGGNLINQQVQINTDIEINGGKLNFQDNVQQKSGGGIQIGSRSYSSPSVSSSSSRTGHKKYSLVKNISKRIKAFQYKHSGKKTYHRHSSRHSRRTVLRCFN
jgi:hypothetical protein